MSSVSFTSPDAEGLAAVLHVHYLTKAYEFVDTFIIVLKGNFGKITVLHAVLPST